MLFSLAYFTPSYILGGIFPLPIASITIPLYPLSTANLMKVSSIPTADLNNEVIAASEATKTDTLALNTFQSITGGPLGVIDCNEFLLYKQITKRTIIDTDNVENKVALFKSAVGMDDTFIRLAVDNGYKGIVIEAMGRGNIPPKMYEGVKYARENNIPVVIVSRCHSGRVFDSYGYLGSGRDLRNLGCIFGGDLPGHKARLKLMLSLGKTNNLDEIKDYFEEGIYY